jgi:hypothetical protein
VQNVAIGVCKLHFKLQKLKEADVQKYLEEVREYKASGEYAEVVKKA